MSEQQADYVTEAMELLHGEPAAIIEQPQRRLVLRDGLGEEWTVAWVKLSTAFKPHIKELRGAPLAVWLYLSLSINKQGVAFPAIRTISEDTGYSHQGVIDAIVILEERGYLKVRRGERRYNLYEPEFAAIGKTNEPSESVNLLDSSKKSQVLPPNESTFSPNESTPLDSNKNNKSKQEKRKLPANSDLAFKLASGMSSEEIADDNRQFLAEKEIRDYYESCMGYNPLNWGGDDDLAKLLKFLMTKTKDEIKQFSDWSKRDFSTFDPVKAKRYPLEVIEFWPLAVVKVPQSTKEDDWL